MRKRTTTKQLQQAISNNQLQIQKVESYNKSSRKTETIAIDRFQECFDFFCESGCFVNAIGWHYEKDFGGDHRFTAETGRMNGTSDVIITVYFGIGENANEEEIERTLLFLEEE